MSQPKSYTNTTYSSTTSLPSPSSSTIGTGRYRGPPSQTRRRAPRESDGLVSPMAVFTAFIDGGSGSVGGGHNNNTYTYNRKREVSRSEHQELAHEREHEHSRKAGPVISAPPKPPIPVSINNINKNHYNGFHYHQRGQRPLTTAWPTTIRDGVGGETYYNGAEDGVDGDIDGSRDGEGQDGLYGGYNDKIVVEHAQQFKATRTKGVLGGGYLEEESEVDLDVDLDADADRPSQSRIRQSRVVGRGSNWSSKSFPRNGRNGGGGGDDFDATSSTGTLSKTPPPTKFAKPITITIGRGTYSNGRVSGSRAHSNQTNQTNQANNTYNRHHQSRQHHHQNHTNGHWRQYQDQDQDHHHYHHRPSASVSNSTYDYSGSSRQHTHRHNPSSSSSSLSSSSSSSSSSSPSFPSSRQQQQNNSNHLNPPHNPPPRAVSSFAFYNTNSKSPISPVSSSSSPSRIRKASVSRTSRPTAPPTAPPRVSSLLPPPRSAATTTNISSSSRIPLSTFTVPAPITAIVDPLTTSHAHPSPSPYPNLNSGSHSHSTFNLVSTKSKTPTSPPSSNAILQEAQAHADFASASLAPLNNKIAVSDTASVLAPNPGRPGLGTAAAAVAGIAIAVGSGAGLGPDPGPPTRRPSHSRANSFGAAGDSLHNLNRWSSSTASSPLDAWDYHHYQQQQARQQKSLTSARRMSVDSIGALTQQPEPVQAQAQDPLPPNHYSSPRKLVKRRPSRGTGTRARTRAGSASTSASTSTSGLLAGGRAIASTRRVPSPPPLLPPSSAPPPNLPPIVSLSPLDTNPPESSFRLGSPRAMSRASPNLNTLNSVFASQPGNAEPQDYFWSDLSNPTRTTSLAMRSNTALLPPAPVTRDRDAISERRGHSRSRSAAKGGSGDSTRPKDRSSSKPSQKAMLSKALSKANTAVQLDNAQNFGAAREAYLEACQLLQQVLSRTNGDDDRKKLDAIRITYTSRIEDLDALVPINPSEDKALPARPDSFDYHGVQMELAGVNNQSEVAMISRSHRDESPNPQLSSQAIRRPSEPTMYRDFSRNADVGQGLRQSSFSRSPMRHNFERDALTIPRSSDESFLPAPLSPRRPSSPPRIPSPEPIVRLDFSLNSERFAVAPEFRSHRRNVSHESASWLDPIDESGGSTASSVHSRSSSRIMRKHIRQPSGDTEAEFDAALDAAVEAAYDDGYEPMEPPVMTYVVDEDRIATSMRRVELAKERVRQTEREAAIELARERERQRQMSLSQQSQTYGGDFFDANDSDEEEERMLEEMTRGYVMEDFSLGRQSRYQSSIPRESDSSGLTSRTWHSSMGSNPPTGTTTLSVVSEVTSSGHIIKTSSPPPMPPPTQSLPEPPSNRPPSTTGVRNRRFSGQNTKQLKIETSKLGPPPPMLPPPINTSSVVQSQPTSNYIAQQRQALSASSTRAGSSSMRAPSSPARGISPADAAGPASPPGGQEDEAQTSSPSSILPAMHKNFSSSSLKSLKSRQMSLSHIDDTDPLPMTPISQQISNSSVTRLPVLPVLPTPIAVTFAEKMAGGVGGLHLFDYDFHSPVAQSPNSAHHYSQQNSDIPLPLEPCPSDSMFRPFWLMRALYQTLAHPRGGYISNRLFVPQDAWKVKGVKLRNIEDKISQCDLLTAALLTLARVDSNDADAMLDEMQVFENLLETVQATLSRRLGTEVGTQGMVTFKDEKETEPPPVPRNNSISGKGGAFSWRRLRSKGSAVNLASTYGGVKTNSSGGGTSGVPGILERDVISPGGTMPSLPMVAQPSSRPAKRDVASVKFDGPNAHYMASLARLFDAAQTVDQIARQVDDPGLRHADKTQVGLELCTRHAAEFFGFYICRFVLTDLGMLLDKFVKRGSEWVLA
ncbi:hypothetical protein GGR58DRAFT_503244 [Xylaria digitata]|nr:hypothetical protein GGR58DRAFT_503244 [Xylaria digitata]